MCSCGKCSACIRNALALGNPNSEYSATTVPEFYAAHIYGYRVFLVRDKKKPDLTGVYHKDIYYPEVNAAGEYYESVCHARNFTHEVPEATCKCGYWAVWDPRKLIDASSGFAEINKRGRMVIGVIEVRGTMLIGTKGFRAKEIRLVALTNDHNFYNYLYRDNIDDPADLLPAIPRKWMTPTYTFNKLLDVYNVSDYMGQDLIRQYPPLDPQTLAPAEPRPVGSQGRYQFMTGSWPDPPPLQK